jgi:hypothetical protein
MSANSKENNTFEVINEYNMIKVDPSQQVDPIILHHNLTY